jgi:hypothetical protein
MPKPSNTAPGRGSQQAPDYAARRMLASAIVITVLVVGGVVVWRALGGGESSSLTAADGTWNQIALVNRTRGTVITVDTAGAAIAEFTGFSRILDVHAERDRIALVGPNEIYVGSFEPENATVSTTPVDTGPVTPTSSAASAGSTSGPTATSTASTSGADQSPPPGFTAVPYPRGSTVTRLPIANRLVLAIGQPRGGNVLLIDGQSGLVVDIGALADQAAPLLFLDTIQFDPDGNVFAIADAANFQTILVTTLPEPAVEFFPDAPLAVSEDFVVTSQVVGQRADVAFFKHDGTTVRSLSMPIPAGAVLTDRGLILVSEDGAISRVAGDLSTPTGLGSIDQPEGTLVARVDPAGSGARLIVSGDSFQTVIDLDGKMIATATFDVGSIVAEPQPGWICLPLGPSDGLVSLVALDDGSVRADVAGINLLGASADGCTLLGEIHTATSVGTTDTPTTTRASTPTNARSTRTTTSTATDTVVIDATDTVSLGPARAALLSPDGTTVVRTNRTSHVELVRRDGETFTEPVDLTDLTQPTALTVAFFNHR